MPTYEFQCKNKECGAIYSEIAPFDKTGKYKKILCPECNSVKKEMRIGGGAFAFSNPVGTDRWTSDGTGHDYRFKYNIPYAKKQRENAEKKSHMGKNPYGNIDDITSGKHFGEVK